MVVYSVMWVTSWHELSDAGFLGSFSSMDTVNSAIEKHRSSFISTVERDRTDYYIYKCIVDNGFKEVQR